MNLYFISLDQNTGDCKVVRFNDKAVLAEFSRVDHKEETYYKALNYLTNLEA